jgi:hypothetical protein
VSNSQSKGSDPTPPMFVRTNYLQPIKKYLEHNMETNEQENINQCENQFFNLHKEIQPNMQFTFTSSNQSNKKSNTQKRNNNEIDLSPPNNKTKLRKHEGVSPILYYNVGNQYNEDKSRLTSEVATAFQDHPVKIKQAKITLNGNLLIFPETIEDKTRILNNKSFIKGAKLLDLGSDEIKYEVIIKGISPSTLQSLTEEIELLQINNIQSIYNQNNTEINKCKISFKTKELQQKFIESGKIKIGFFNYKVEQLAKQVKMCLNCKSYDHPSYKCRSNVKCAKCGDEHKTEECSNNNLKCPNCGEAHSAYYKGCKKYKSLFQEQINKIRMASSLKEEDKSTHKKSNEPKAQTIRNYSAIVSPDENQKSIDSKINEIVTNKLEAIKNDITNTLAQIKTLSDSITNNNLKLVHFVIDTIKIQINNRLKRLINATLGTS